MFEAGMLYWHYPPSTTIPLGPAWAPRSVRDEIKFYPSRHCLVYIVEDEEGDSPTTESED